MLLARCAGTLYFKQVSLWYAFVHALQAPALAALQLNFRLGILPIRGSTIRLPTKICAPVCDAPLTLLFMALPIHSVSGGHLQSSCTDLSKRRSQRVDRCPTPSLPPLGGPVSVAEQRVADQRGLSPDARVRAQAQRRRDHLQVGLHCGAGTLRRFAAIHLARKVRYGDWLQCTLPIRYGATLISTSRGARNGDSGCPYCRMNSHLQGVCRRSGSARVACVESFVS